MGSPCHAKHCEQAHRAQEPKVRIAIVAACETSNTFRPVEILGIEGAKPEENAVAPCVPRAQPDAAGAHHSQCLTGDVLISERCDCRAQLDFPLRKIARQLQGSAVSSARGTRIGLMKQVARIRTAGQRNGHGRSQRETGFAADSRDYSFFPPARCACLAFAACVCSQTIPTSAATRSAGIRVVERVPCRPQTSHVSRAYLERNERKWAICWIVCNSGLGQFTNNIDQEDIYAPVIQSGAIYHNATPAMLYEFSWIQQSILATACPQKSAAGGRKMVRFRGMICGKTLALIRTNDCANLAFDRLEKGRSGFYPRMSV